LQENEALSDRASNFLDSVRRVDWSFTPGHSAHVYRHKHPGVGLCLIHGIRLAAIRIFSVPEL
ncbi:MAG: hypothetical protein WBG35_06270, partial [Acidobacteriaceae bacterium]